MKKLTQILSILLLVMMISPQLTSSADVEREALIALFISTNGGGWTNNNNWITDTPYCSWYGVGCNLSGNVDILSLAHNQLSGSIPPELGNLSSLYRLDLSSNKLGGPIPPELGNLSNLGYLYLYSNQISGSIPPELSNLSGLWLLLLGSNQLSGPIPPELGNFSNLTWLLLDSNQLSGPIPAELSNLSRLEFLFLDSNPSLVCWETEAASIWAQSLPGFSGPSNECDFVYFPMVTR